MESPEAEASPDKPMRRIEISLVLPVYNERDCVARLDEELRQALEKTGREAEIIYVDDCSTDGTFEILRQIVRSVGLSAFRTRVVSLRRNYGQTAALGAGFDLAKGDIIIALDADGQNDPADIPRLVEKLEEGFDVVSGWRRPRRDRFLSRRVPSAIANWLISKITEVPLHDTGCTLKAYRASLLREVRLYGDMHRFLPVFLARQGARIGELEVSHRPRFGGKSKYGAGRALSVAADLVHIRFISRFYTRPMHFFGLLASTFFFATLLVIFFMFAFKFTWLSPLGISYQASFVATPLPSLAATFFLGGVVSLFFGLLAEILIRIHHESSGLPAYAVRSIDDSRDRRD